MKRATFGYLPLYIKLYDDTGTESREPLEAYMRSIVQMRGLRGLDIVAARFAHQMKNLALPSTLLEQDVAAIIRKHSIPVALILSAFKPRVPHHCPDTIRRLRPIDRAGYYTVIAKTWHHGVQELPAASGLTCSNFLCTGHVLHSAVLADVMGKCRRAAPSAQAFRRARVGALWRSLSGHARFSN